MDKLDGERIKEQEGQRGDTQRSKERKEGKATGTEREK